MEKCIVEEANKALLSSIMTSVAWTEAFGNGEAHEKDRTQEQKQERIHSRSSKKSKSKSKSKTSSMSSSTSRKEIVRAAFAAQPCLLLHHEWWSFQLCFERDVRQFHQVQAQKSMTLDILHIRLCLASSWARLEWTKDRDMRFNLRISRCQKGLSLVLCNRLDRLSLVM